MWKSVGRNETDGTFVIERPCKLSLFPGEDATGSGPARSAIWAVARRSLKKCCSEAFRLSRAEEPNHPPHPPVPDSLNRFSQSCDHNTHRTHNNLPTYNMSDYGGGDDEPMDYAMGECASPLHAKSRKSFVADAGTGRTRTTSSTRTTFWSRTSMDPRATAAPMATWTMTWTTSSRAET